jgi:hypothetical protein
MNNLTQNLRRDLQGVAADLKWSAVELVRIADRLSQAGNEPDAQALHRMIKVFQDGEEKVSSMVDGINVGEIVRQDSVSA